MSLEYSVTLSNNLFSAYQQINRKIMPSVGGERDRPQSNDDARGDR